MSTNTYSKRRGGEGGGGSTQQSFILRDSALIVQLITLLYNNNNDLYLHDHTNTYGIAKAMFRNQNYNTGQFLLFLPCCKL